MRTLTTALLCLFMLAAGSALCHAAEQDVKGSKDHPLISRMPGFHISDYKEQEFGSVKFLDAQGKPLVIEGHHYYYQYNLDKGQKEPGEKMIRRNIQNALKKVGAEVVFDQDFNRVSTIVLRKEGKEAWVDVRSFNNMYRLTIVERGAMRQEVVAKAELMGKDINSTGHVSVYGIYFDTGKADLKPESEAALAEIAKLMKDNAALKLYVVGHTDNVGGLEPNRKLSQARAEAVVGALTGKHGINAGRLSPHGVASLAPVATNDTEEGRAQNRRVELVKQ